MAVFVVVVTSLVEEDVVEEATETEGGDEEEAEDAVEDEDVCGSLFNRINSDPELDTSSEMNVSKSASPEESLMSKIFANPGDGIGENLFPAALATFGGKGGGGGDGGERDFRGLLLFGGKTSN